MKYLLDFDRTVFETDAFKRSLKERPTFLELLWEGKAALQELFAATDRTSRRRILLKNLGTFLSHGRFMFTPEELRSFLYPDAKDFLLTHDCTIVTYGVRAFITAKVSVALIEHPELEILYTSRKKGRVIRQFTNLHAGAGPFVFVDDMPFQLESVDKWCPDVELVEIRRDGARGDGRWRVIGSFTDLVPVLFPLP